MKTKTLTLILSMVMITVISQAQGIGIRAGFGFQNINGKDDNGDKLEYKMIPAFNIGANYEISVADEFYVQPGLLFAKKGAKYEISDITNKSNIYYLDIPINFVYKPAFYNGKLILGFGPYFAFGIKGTYKIETSGTSSVDIKFKNKVTSDDPDGIYSRRMDAGANLLFGYELSSRLSFQLDAQLGLVNLEPDYEGTTDDSDSKMSNTGFGISAGYRF